MNTPTGTPRGKGNAPKAGSTGQGDRLCIKHFWGKCNDIENCTFGAHVDKPNETIQKHHFYGKLCKENGWPKALPAEEDRLAGSADS